MTNDAFGYFLPAVCLQLACSVRNWILDAGLAESPQPEQATVTFAARQIFRLVAGPRKVQWSIQCNTLPHDLRFAHVNQRRADFDARLRFSSKIRRSLKGIEELLAAVGIT